MYLPPPGPGIAGRFLTIINGLCRALGGYSADDRTAMPLVDVIFTALRRRAKRFAALVARFEAGLAPPPRRHRGAASDAAVFERVRPPSDMVPRGRCSLLLMLKHGCTEWLDPLRDLVAEPEMAALIAADPRVARLLRPLWFMLNPQPLPDVLRPPPAEAPRPSRRKIARVLRAVRPAPPPAPEPPAVRRTRSPYIPGFGPPLPA